MADIYMVVREDGDGMFFSEPEFFDGLDEAKMSASKMLDQRKTGHSVEIYECRHKWTA